MVTSGGEGDDVRKWDVQLLPRAQKALGKLDRPTGRRIRAKLAELSQRESPESACKALSGPLTGLWRYRVGEYRVVCDIQRNVLVIVAIDIGHRSDIYS